MKCPACNKENRKDAQYCAYCRYPLRNVNKREKPKKRNWKLVAVLVSVIVLLVGVGGYFGFKYLGGLTGNPKDSLFTHKDEEENYEVIDGEAKSHLILYVDKTHFSSSDDSEITMTIKIPETWELAPIDILTGSGDSIASFMPVHRETVEAQELGGVGYQSFEADVAISMTDSDENAISVFAQMGNEVSNEVVLYRDVSITEDMTNRMCDVLDEASGIVEQYDWKNNVTNEESLAISIQEVSSEVLLFLQQHPDIDSASIEEDGNICFTTADGLVSAIVLKPVYNDPALDTRALGSSTSSQPGVTTDPDELESIFEMDYSYKAVAIDPDVLVICPLEKSCKTLLTGTSKNAGKDIANALQGTYTTITDSVDKAEPLRRIISESLTEYGSIIMDTHGGSLNRGDGTNCVLFDMYRSSDETTANAAWNSIVANCHVDASDCYDYVYSNNNEEDLHSIEMAFILGYDISISNSVFDIELLKHYDIGTTTNWFMDHWANVMFPNTLVYFNTCHSEDDELFNEFLFDHGVVCYAGYTGEIYEFLSISMTKKLFSTLLEKDSSYSSDDESGRNKLISSISWRPDCYGYRDYTIEGFGKIKGKVVDQEGNPVEGAKVHAYRFWNGVLKEECMVAANSDGSYSIPRFKWGIYLLQAEDGSVEAFRQLSFANHNQDGMDFVLEQTSISVTVFNEDSEFLSNANVACIGSNGLAYVLPLIQENGPVFTAKLNAGDYRVTVSCEGYEGQSQAIMVDGSSELSFVLKKAKVEDEVLEYNGHYYKVFGIPISWEGARTYCESIGGHLVTITSAGEQNAITQYLQNTTPDTDLWIGFSDSLDEGNWSYWVTGEIVTYQNWGEGEPDSDRVGHEQDYGIIANGYRKGSWYNIAPGQWDDIDNDDSTNRGYFICEWENLAQYQKYVP